jgi:hypothetical protein
MGEGHLGRVINLRATAILSPARTETGYQALLHFPPVFLTGQIHQEATKKRSDDNVVHKVTIMKHQYIYRAGT